jgi:hypothetical protein
VLTDVSEEHAASIVKVDEYVSLYRHVTTMTAMRPKQSGCSPFASLCSSAFEAVAKGTSETAAFVLKTIW